MNALLSLLALVGVWMFVSQRWRLDSAPALMFSVASILATLFIGGMLNTLDVFVWGLRGIGLVALLVASRRWWSLRVRQLPGPAVVIPVVLVIVFWMLHRDATYFYYDEFSHWGIYLRDMLASGMFWGGETNSMHPRYVPGSVLWQYFFSQGSSFVRPDGFAYLAQFILLLTPLGLLWHRMTWADWPWALGLLLILILALAAFSPGVVSLYVDHLLSAWWVGTLLLYWHMEDTPQRRLALLALPLVVLALLKSVGLVLAAAAVGAMALQEVMTGRHPQHATAPALFSRIRVVVFASLILMMPAILVVVAWDWQRDAVGAKPSDESVAAVISSVVQRPDDDRAKTVVEIQRRYIDVLTHQQLGKQALSWEYNSFTYPLRPLYTDRHRLSYVGLLGAAAVLWWLAVGVVVPRGLRPRAALLGLGIGISAAGYAVMLFFFYRMWNSPNSILLDSVLRHLHVLAMPIFILVFVVLTPSFSRIREERPESSPVAAAIFVLVLALYTWNEPPFLRPLLVSREYHPLRAQTDAVASNLRELAAGGKVWIFLPNDMPNNFIGRLLQFQLSPVPTQVERSSDFWSGDPSLIGSVLSGHTVIWFPVEGFTIPRAATWFGSSAPSGIYLRGPDGRFRQL